MNSTRIEVRVRNEKVHGLDGLSDVRVQAALLSESQNRQYIERKNYLDYSGRNIFVNPFPLFLVCDVVDAIEKVFGKNWLSAVRKKLEEANLLNAPCDILLISEPVKTADQEKIEQLEKELKISRQETESYKRALKKACDAMGMLNGNPEFYLHQINVS